MLPLFELNQVQLRQIQDRQIVAIKKLLMATQIGAEQDAMPLANMTYSELKKFVRALIFGSYEIFVGLEEKDLEIGFSALLEYLLRCSWRLYSSNEDQALVLFSENRSSFFHPASEFCIYRSGIYEDLPEVVREIYVRIGHPSGVNIFSDISIFDFDDGFGPTHRQKFLGNWGFSVPDEILEDSDIFGTIEKFSDELTSSTFPLAYYKGAPNWSLIRAACVECRSKQL